MKKLTVFLFTCLIIIFSSLNSQEKKVQEKQPKFVPGELIIKFRNVNNENFDPTKIPSIDKLNKKYKAKKIERVFKHIKKPTTRKFSKIKKTEVTVPDLFPVYKIKFDENVDIEKIAEEYRKDPNVEYAHPNYIPVLHTIPNDSYFDLQWGLHNTGQTGGTADADIDAPQAWDVEKGRSDVIVAVIDTGVDWDHPDLFDNIWLNTLDPIDGIDNDGNGYVDDYLGWDFADDDNDPMDYHGHGTHAAGIISAVSDNLIGVAGVSWYTRIMAVKIFHDDGSGGGSDVEAKAIIYAADNGAKILSNSWGYTDPGKFPDIVKDAIDYANSLGCLVIFAAGNENSSLLYYPAAYPGVVSVGATDHNDVKATFSNFGTWVDVSAPGVDIYI